MSNPAHIYFYGEDKILSLKKNPVLLNVFEIFPITKLSLKRILDQKHQWISDSAYYVPDVKKQDWVVAVTLGILIIGIVSTYRSSYANKHQISLNDSQVNDAVNTLLPDDLLNDGGDLGDLKANLSKALPGLLKDYVDQNFVSEPNVITTGVVDLFIKNADTLHLQLSQDEIDKSLSLLQFDSVSSLNSNIKNYLLVSINDVGQKLKIDFTNSKDHAGLLGRFVATLLSDSSLNVTKSFLNKDEQAEIYSFATTDDFLSFYKSLQLEVKFSLDHGTFLEIVNEYGSLNPSLKSVNENLERQISAVLEDFKNSPDFSRYLGSRENLIQIVHQALKATSFEVEPIQLVSDLDDMITDHKVVTFNDVDTFKQIKFLKA